jgi:hypothetical protein
MEAFKLIRAYRSEINFLQSLIDGMLAGWITQRAKRNGMMVDITSEVIAKHQKQIARKEALMAELEAERTSLSRGQNPKRS